MNGIEAAFIARVGTEPGKAVWSRGHGPKILQALRSATAKGLLPANPRPVEFRKIILDELDELGYREMPRPSRTAIDVRYAAVYGRGG
jgi:hypothetical protein